MGELIFKKEFTTEKEALDFISAIRTNSNIVCKEPFYEKMEKDIYSSLRKAMNSWFMGLDKSTNVEDALVSLKKSLIKWDFDILKKDASIMIPLHNFTDSVFNNTKEIIKSQPMGSYIQKKSIDSEIKKCILKL